MNVSLEGTLKVDYEGCSCEPSKRWIFRNRKEGRIECGVCGAVLHAAISGGHIKVPFGARVERDRGHLPGYQRDPFVRH